MASVLFADSCRYHHELGYYQHTYAGHITDNSLRLRSSSGGIITWLGTEMLRNRMIDGIIHVVRNATGGTEPPIFSYAVSRSVEDLRRGAKSKYYPVELSNVLHAVKATPGRYAIVGVPCFVKAIRRLVLVDPVINERVRYLIGLVCGHLKSCYFAELLASQMHIAYDNLTSFDFRVKLPGASASGYGVRATGSASDSTRPISALFGTNWGLHLFRYGACDFCDDVFAETADVSIGDAWIPPYQDDWMGNSVIVIRRSEIADLVQQGIKSDELKLDEVTPETLASSQSGGLRDRREDILFRMQMRRRKGLWHPKKRDFSHRIPGFRRRCLIKTRMSLRAASFHEWSKPLVRGNPKAFVASMKPLLLLYRIQTRGLIRSLAACLLHPFGAIIRNLRINL